MQLSLTEDQILLARTATGFFAEHAPITRLRQLRDSQDARGYSLAVLAKMAELGWTAIPFLERDGGLGMGLAELCLVTEAMGRTLSPEPLIASVVLAGRALALAGNDEQREAYLPSLLSGQSVLALAHSRPRGRFDPTRAPFTAARTSTGFTLSGQATLVWGGHLAAGYVVVARTAGADGAREGLSLFLLPADTRGLQSERQWRVDSLNSSLLGLDAVHVDTAQLLGTVDAGFSTLSRVLDEATVALCGEMLGGMSAAFDSTRAYLRERRQFGVPIGSFQALKHRAARLYVELELSRSAVMAAARALDEQQPDAPLLVSLAKARLSDAYCLVANEAVQMFGGIGMTDEHDIGFYLKRARASELSLGDAAHHRERFARLSGY
jgi:alkylation response protein AidB-like acyl-CoA dehydrogenase